MTLIFQISCSYFLFCVCINIFFFFHHVILYNDVKRLASSHQTVMQPSIVLIEKKMWTVIIFSFLFTDIKKKRSTPTIPPYIRICTYHVIYMWLTCDQNLKKLFWLIYPKDFKYMYHFLSLVNLSICQQVLKNYIKIWTVFFSVH